MAVLERDVIGVALLVLMLPHECTWRYPPVPVRRCSHRRPYCHRGLFRCPVGQRFGDGSKGDLSGQPLPVAIPAVGRPGLSGRTRAVFGNEPLRRQIRPRLILLGARERLMNRMHRVVEVLLTRLIDVEAKRIGAASGLRGWAFGWTIFRARKIGVRDRVRRYIHQGGFQGAWIRGGWPAGYRSTAVPSESVISDRRRGPSLSDLGVTLMRISDPGDPVV